MNPAGWSPLLDQLQEALNQTSAEADRQEADLASLLADGGSATKHEQWERRLHEATERLQECRVRVEEASRQAGTAESDLAEQQEQLRQFRQRLIAFRQKLADFPDVAIE